MNIVDKPTGKIFAVLLIIIGILIVSKLDCIKLRISGIPDSMKSVGNKENRWIFLFGKTICFTCPIGEFILKEAGDGNTTYILPVDYSEVDIEIFKRSFPVKGRVSIANKELNRFYGTICRCLRKEGKSILVEISGKRMVKLVKTIG